MVDRSSDRSAPPTEAHTPLHHAGHRSLVGRGWSRREAIEALDHPERRESERTEEVWAHAHLRPGETVAEVGAGTGFYAISAARTVGRDGRVFAVDLSEELVELIHERAQEHDLPQLEAVKGEVDRIPLPTGCADLVLFANVLHDIPDTTVAEAVRLLRPAGRLVNVDWRPVPSPGGPPVEVRLAPAAAVERLARFGLAELETWPLGPWHYGITLHRR